MKTEKLVDSVQAVVFLFAFGGYGYSLYHFLSFYAQNNDLNWVSVGLSAFLFMLPWALIGALLAFAGKVAITSLTGIFTTAQTVFRH
nr:MAG TPA: hypothetical protein [Caudoviricetes sp.]